MKLYLMRHGDAEPMSSSDHNRRLTDKGIRRTHNAAKVIAAMELAPTKIFSSPRVRAMQTAEIVAKALNIPVTQHESVNFGFSVNAVGQLVRENPQAAELMFVGHEPTMSNVVEELTGARIDMKKGSFARIDLFDLTVMYGTLVWLIAPKVFDALGE